MIHYYLMPHPPIMIESIGRGREREIKKTIEACLKIKQQIKEDEIETLIIITPHGPVFRDAVAIMNEKRLSGHLGSFGAKQEQLSFTVDQDLVEKIIQEVEAEHISIVSLDRLLAMRYRLDVELDHGAFVPLYYAAEPHHKIVHLTYGLLAPIELYRVGMAIAKAIKQQDKKIALIASGDLSHCLTKDGAYPYHENGPIFDKMLMNILSKGEFEDLFALPSKIIIDSQQCGLRSLYMLAGTLEGYKVSSNILSYEGPFGVGYGVVEFKATKGDSVYEKIEQARLLNHEQALKEDNPYTTLARQNLATFFHEGRSLSVNELNNELKHDQKGVFVSLKKEHQLRGCIGTFLPTTSCIGEEIIKNSLQAAFHDPRFSPLKADELYDITISVDLLEPPVSCHKADLDPHRYGVIVSYGQKRGLLLPNLEGVDSVEEQLGIALQKANIDETAPYEIERFEVTRYEEGDL